MTWELKAWLVVWNFVRYAEPVATAHAVSAVVSVVVGAKSGHLDLGAAAAAWLLVQGVLTRRVVTPVPSIPAGLAALVSAQDPPK